MNGRTNRSIAVVVAAAFALAGAAPAAAEDLAKLNSEILGLYGEMHVALADDSATGVKTTAGKLSVKAASASRFANDAVPYQELAQASGKVAAELDIELLRQQFKGLSMAIAKLVESGALAGADIYYCPMADGYWLQAAADAGVKNPYYGKSMLKCGSKTDKVEG
jgi:hypothetical protein